MNKSWAHPVVSAYEVKVSRADFLKDNKWPAYLPLCNQFYFVAPAGLIDLSELPAEAGLLTASGKGNGARLLTKKKAPHRDITVPEEVYRYILMCRVVPTAESAFEQQTHADYWRKWLKEKREDQKLGWRVSRRVAERATEIEIENYRLQKEVEKFAELQQWLDSQGFRIHDWALHSHIEDRYRAQETVFDQSLIKAMQEARNKIDTALTVAGQMEEEAKPAKTAIA